MIEGIGKDAPTTVNDAGGKQSAVNFRFDLMDPTAMFSLGRILAEGERKYGVDNWRKISQRDHINHALIHIYAYLAGDTQDEHLEHAFCRLMFALGVDEEIRLPKGKHRHRWVLGTSRDRRMCLDCGILEPGIGVDTHD